MLDMRIAAEPYEDLSSMISASSSRATVPLGTGGARLFVVGGTGGAGFPDTAGAVSVGSSLHSICCQP